MDEGAPNAVESSRTLTACSLESAAKGEPVGDLEADPPDTATSEDAPEAPAGKTTRVRQNFSWRQISVLEQVFESDPFSRPTVRSKLAEGLGVAPRSVQVWFQNRRQKWKSAQQALGHKPCPLKDVSGRLAVLEQLLPYASGPDAQRVFAPAQAQQTMMGAPPPPPAGWQQAALGQQAPLGGISSGWQQTALGMPSSGVAVQPTMPSHQSWMQVASMPVLNQSSDADPLSSAMPASSASSTSYGAMHPPVPSAWQRAALGLPPLASGMPGELPPPMPGDWQKAALGLQPNAQPNAPQVSTAPAAQAQAPAPAQALPMPGAVPSVATPTPTACYQYAMPMPMPMQQSVLVESQGGQYQPMQPMPPGGLVMMIPAPMQQMQQAQMQQAPMHTTGWVAQ